ncbi:MAG: hypothetical protein JWN76_3633 [Chitinophagaceae bacterium]|nr:hypothetical protein [Chitinophagaceae bacterium]
MNERFSILFWFLTSIVLSLGLVSYLSFVENNIAGAMYVLPGLTGETEQAPVVFIEVSATLFISCVVAISCLIRQMKKYLSVRVPFSGQSKFNIYV